MMTLNGLAAWTGLLCGLVGFAALAMALFAAGSGHLGWAMVAAAVLLGSGAAISITNTIAFGIWYWELDSGGPFTRRTPKRRYPDFMFPQMANPELAHQIGRPTSSTISTSA